MNEHFKAGFEKMASTALSRRMAQKVFGKTPKELNVAGKGGTLTSQARYVKGLESEKKSLGGLASHDTTDTAIKARNSRRWRAAKASRDKRPLRTQKEIALLRARYTGAKG